MLPIYRDYLDAARAQLQRQTAASAGPYGYGRDLSCVQDCDPLFSEVDPFSPQAVQEALLRRLITPRGSLLGSALNGSAELDEDAANYGLDLRSLLHVGLTPTQLASIEQQIKDELIKDDRVVQVHVTVGIAGDPTNVMLNCKIDVEAEPPIGTFSFVFSVDEYLLSVAA